MVNKAMKARGDTKFKVKIERKFKQAVHSALSRLFPDIYFLLILCNHTAKLCIGSSRAPLDEFPLKSVSRVMREV